MRYDADHKQRSRERIVEAGRSLFRRRGFDGASIDQVMADAGLTRGAFYAHFDSKDDLIREVLEIESGLVSQLLRASDATHPRAFALDVLAGYLDPDQRASITTGCPLIAHPVDAIRGNDVRRNGYTERLRALVDSLEIAGGSATRDESILVAVLAVGGGLLSGACSDPDLADSIEQACFNQIETLLEQPADTT